MHGSQALQQTTILIHGDSKLDNFLFKKIAWSDENAHEAKLIDWQVSEGMILHCSFSNQLLFCAVEPDYNFTEE